MVEICNKIGTRFLPGRQTSNPSEIIWDSLKHMKYLLKLD